MPAGSVPHSIKLSRNDRLTLTYLTDQPDAGHLLKVRAMIVIASAKRGATISGIARALGVSRPTVTLWRSRFVARGIEGLIAAEDIEGGYEAHHWKASEYRERHAMLTSSQDGAHHPKSP